MVFEASDDGTKPPTVAALKTCDYLELQNQEPVACVHADWSERLLKRKKLEVGVLCEAPLLFDERNANGSRTWRDASGKLWWPSVERKSSRPWHAVPSPPVQLGWWWSTTRMSLMMTLRWHRRTPIDLSRFRPSWRPRPVPSCSTAEPRKRGSYEGIIARPHPRTHGCFSSCG